MGNEGIYSVGKEFGKTPFLFAKQRVSWVPGMTLQLLVMCFTRGLSRVALLVNFSRASHELH